MSVSAPALSRIRWFLLVAWLPMLMSAPSMADLSRKARLGEQLFHDTSLSEPPGQACASCHDPERFFTDPDDHEPTSEGVIPGRYGKRNAPTLMYAAPTPVFHFDRQEGLFIGGQFLDGRAPGLKSQAKQPFLEALEMNNPDPESVVAKVRVAGYADLFRRVYGKGSLDDGPAAFARIADAIAAFERTSRFAPMTSKYDYYLMGKARFTAQERRGRELFESEDKGNCAACHPSRPANNGANWPLFTDFTYDNLGVPRNRANLFYTQAPEFNPQGFGFVDAGLGDHVKDRLEDGKFKVPTLRNIARTAPYMHNGYFKTLRGVVDFYNTRDLKPRCRNDWATEVQALREGCWPAPEVAANVNHDELGKLGLTEREVDDLVAFLMTLTDGYQP